MGVNMRASGLTITWMELECTLGRTGDSIGASTKTTRSTVSASTLGQMVALTGVIGVEASNMAWVPTRYQASRPRMAYGKTASA